MSDASAVSAGRGVVYIGLAKIYFIIAGYAIYFALPRLLGSPVAWGEYLLVIGLVSVVNNVIVTATIQGVSKFTAQGDVSAAAVQRTALRVQVVLGGGAAALFAAAAPWIAAWERDPRLARWYALAAGIIVCYAFYAVFIGSLNGLRRFREQAAFDASFATLRALLIIGGAGVGWGVAGAVGGFVGAAALILVAALWRVGWPVRDGEALASGRLWRLMLELFASTLALNLVMRADLLLLKRFATALAARTLDTAAAMAAASAAAGYYGTAQSLAFIPYQLILAVTFVVFPLVSRSTFAADHAATRLYIHRTLRLSLIFVAGLAAVLMANPEAVITVLYPAIYRAGGPALRWLAAGMVCFSLLTVSNTILNGAGHTRAVIVTTLATLLLLVAANAFAVPRSASPSAALEVAAAATALAMLAGLGIATLLLRRTLGAALPWGTVWRVLVAWGLATVVGAWLPERSRFLTLIECGLVLLTYGVALVVLGELGRQDVQLLRGGRPQGPPPMTAGNAREGDGGR